MSIQTNLERLAHQEIQERNLINHYLPFRQQRNKPAEYDFDAIAGDVLSSALRIKLKQGYSLESFVERARAAVSSKLSDDSINDFIDQMYFDGSGKSGLFKVSPEFLLFKANSAEAGASKHVCRLFRSFLATRQKEIPLLMNEVNFLEAELLSELQENLTSHAPDSTEVPYLPFLAEFFSKDLNFLCQHPSYLLQNTRAFLGLYNFLYSAQLALNINAWDSTPETKPLYFILDTERASVERKQVRESYPWLKEKVADLFPILSMLEYFNQIQEKNAPRYPLWRFVEHIKNASSEEQLVGVKAMQEFAKNYCAKRGVDIPDQLPHSEASMVKFLTASAREIFSKRGSSQFTVNSRVVNAFENEVAQHFVQSRGRSGRVLILNQDYLLLLTNLAVGEREQLQFQQLLEAFKNRGIWFDRQSEQALINFYERVGNVERMSDSGDAVYVRKTL
ncbi:DNA phosphorothioation-dependent restriction protein DptG [Nitrincola sp.]|uniref:DNA phosphorothioation-dependent restriction protein DptG n=1 Tax=Nitrincola sp. TaxID=1926584 RepID=UPI003A8D3FB7